MLLTLPADEAVPGDLAEMLATDPPEPGARLVSYVVVAEWVDAEGVRQITGESNCPPWTSSGLMTFAMENDLCYDTDDFE